MDVQDQDQVQVLPLEVSFVLCVPPGLLWQLRPSDVEVELLAHTRNVVSKDLEEETGLHTGWIQNGGLFIASNKQRLDEYKRLMSVRPSSCGTGAASSSPRMKTNISSSLATFTLAQMQSQMIKEHI